MAIEFSVLSPENANAWDAVVANSDDGWLFGLSYWQKLITSIPEWRFTDKSFAIYDDRRLVAAMPMQMTADGRLVSAALGAAGPFVVRNVSPGRREKIIYAAIEHSRDVAREGGVRKIEVSISALNKTSLASVHGVNLLVNYGFLDVSTHERIVNLVQSEEVLWAGLSSDARQNIKHARSTGYAVTVESWQEMLEEYYRIHVETYTRTGVSPHPKSYFHGIAIQAASRGHSKLLVARAPDGVIVGFHNSGRYEQASFYWTGCCATDHLKSGVNYLLMWNALLAAKTDGCNHYGVGESFPNANEGKLRGLTVFKAKFGGELHRLYKGELIIGSRVAVQQPSVRIVARDWWYTTRMLLAVFLQWLKKRCGLRVLLTKRLPRR